VAVRTLEIEGLSTISAEDFARYGVIVGNCHGDPLEDSPHLSYWSNHVDIGPDNEGLDFGFLLCKTSLEPVEMESHPRTREIFLPLQGTAVFLLAPPREDGLGPDLAGLRAVHLDGAVGIALHAGTWHRPPWPLGGGFASFALLRKGELVDPTRSQELGLNVIIVGVSADENVELRI